MQEEGKTPSPLGEELFQLFIRFDSEVMHKIMCKNGCYIKNLHSGAKLTKHRHLAASAKRHTRFRMAKPIDGRVFATVASVCLGQWAYVDV